MVSAIAVLSALTNDSSNLNGLGDQGGCSEFGDLFADLVVGEPCASARGNQQDGDENQRSDAIKKKP